MTPTELAELVRTEARAAGFARVGIARPTPGLGMPALDRWLAGGMAGTMDWMARLRDARADPGLVLPGVKAIVMVAGPVPVPDHPPIERGRGRIAGFARGDDYHLVAKAGLKRVRRALERAAPGVRCRITVDSAPLPERDYARLSGLGWFGRNTLLLDRDLGSRFFLAAMLTTAPLPADEPFESDHCGSCTRCLVACPTDAFPAPGQLDSRRCISYLTIEHAGPIEPELAERMGDHLFGCDICQEVCPWNHPSPGRGRFAPLADSPHPVEAFGVTDPPPYLAPQGGRDSTGRSTPIERNRLENRTRQDAAPGAPAPMARTSMSLTETAKRDVAHRSGPPAPRADSPHAADGAPGADSTEADAIPTRRRRELDRMKRGELSLSSRPGFDSIDLAEILELDEADFIARFDGTTIERSGRGRLIRNAVIAAANTGSAELQPALERLQRTESDPGIQSALAFALERLGGTAASDVGTRAAEREPLRGRPEAS
jgi:epoxyqueuosine reductase